MGNTIAKPDRRDFIFTSAVLGLSILATPTIFSKILRASVDHNEYTGPLAEKILTLISKLDRREISSAQFTEELEKRYAEMDIISEFERWLEPQSQGEDTYFLYKFPYGRLKIFYNASGT